MFGIVRSKGTPKVYARIRHADGTVTDLGMLTRTPWYRRLIEKVRKHGK